MATKKVEFVYVSDVFCPEYLIGSAGETKELAVEHAELLQRQGYGNIKAEPENEEEPVKKTSGSKKKS